MSYIVHVGSYWSNFGHRELPINGNTFMEVRLEVFLQQFEVQAMKFSSRSSNYWNFSIEVRLEDFENGKGFDKVQNGKNVLPRAGFNVSQIFDLRQKEVV